MGTANYDLTTESVESPISIGGTFVSSTAGPAIDLVDSSGIKGRVNSTALGTNDQISYIDGGVQAYDAADQYCEVTKTSTNTFDSIDGACFCDATNGYYILIRYFSTNSNNKLQKIVSGTVSDVTSGGLGSVDFTSVVKVGLRASHSGGTTTLKVYADPTTYDGSGFPTDGLVLTATDTSLSSGQPGVFGRWGDSRATYIDNIYTAGTSGGGGGGVHYSIDPRKRGRAVL